MTVWEYWPFKSDPTPEERAKIMAEAGEKQRSSTDAEARRILQEHRIAKKQKYQ